MNNYWQTSEGCPRLFLAPMEGLGDAFFRKAYALVGGFDEACTEFLRVPRNAHVRSLAKRYDSEETRPYPIAAQLMGETPELMAAMAVEVEARGAPRIDLNCGCPSNTVVGRGAGSSLLRTPDRLYQIAKAMVDAVKVPVTVKLRAGYSDTSLFEENLLAAQDAGAAFVTLHPRTKMEGYGPPARWELVAQAKALLRIPVVGSGDILSGEDAVRRHRETGCDGLMIGRGAVANPWIFHEVRACFAAEPLPHPQGTVEKFLRRFVDLLQECPRPRTQINKLKQLAHYMLQEQGASRLELLRRCDLSPKDFAELMIQHLQKKPLLGYK